MARDSLHVLEFDREADAPTIKIGTKISRIGAAAQVLEEQKPVFLPDVSQEMLKHPELAPFAAEICRTNHLFVSRVYRPATIRISRCDKVAGRRNSSPKMSNCSVLWRRTLRLRSNARWRGTTQSCTSDKW